MDDRILPEYKIVLGQEMIEALSQALGYASMCWSEPPTGVFESENAQKVGKELVDIIVQFAQEYPCEHTEDGMRLRNAG